MGAEEVEVFRGAAVPGQRELVESILRDEGIPYVIRSEGGIAEHPVAVGPMGEFVALVPEERADDARAVLGAATASVPFEEDEQEDDGDQPVGLLSSVRRRPTAAQKVRYRWLSGAMLVAGVILMLLQPSPIWLLGLACVVTGLALLGESFR